MLVALEIAKWVADTFFLGATIMMLNQNAAAKSIIPWILFLFGNLIWLVDSIAGNNYPWIVLSVCFCLLDAAILIQRVRNQNVIA